MAVQAEYRVPLNRDRVLRAALDLVDEGGVEALSMRKLGQMLGVEAMSLYNHVANKDDILDGIADVVWREIDLPVPGEEWEEAIRACAISAHDMLIRHRWAPKLIMSSSRVRPARLEYMESLLRCFRESGFSADATYHAYHAVDSLILGFTLWQLGHQLPVNIPPVRTKEDVVLFFAKFFPNLSLDNYPYLLEHGLQHLGDGPLKGQSEYEFSLGLVLDGLKRMRDES